jgi:hypothetical protein
MPDCIRRCYPCLRTCVTHLSGLYRYVFSLFQEQSYGALTEKLPIYPVIFGWGRPPTFLQVNQPIMVVGRLRTRNFEQNMRRQVAKALQAAGRAAEVEALAGPLPEELRDRRVAIEIVADRIVPLDQDRGGP